MENKYWSTIELEIILLKEIHIYKDMWTMIGMRWSPSSLALPFSALFLLGSYNAYGISQLPFSHKPYGFIQTLFTLDYLTNTILEQQATPMLYIPHSLFTSSQRIPISLSLTMIVRCLSFLNTLFSNDMVFDNFKLSSKYVSFSFFNNMLVQNVVLPPFSKHMSHHCEVSLLF